MDLDLVTSVAAGSGRMLVLVLRHLIRISSVGATKLSILLPGYITPAPTQKTRILAKVSYF